MFEAMERRLVFSAGGLAEPAALTAAATPAQLAADESAVGKSIDAFALDLYGQLQSTVGGNVFVSPFSIATALAMTYAGAGGQTAQQMAAVLHLDSAGGSGADLGAVENQFGELLDDLNSAGQSGGYLLSVANALWAQQGLDILPEFLNVIQSDFSGGLQQADFVDDAEAARQTINNWVAQQTNGKIQDLLPPGSLDDMTRLVLANAVYFKAAWSLPFNASQTSNAQFTLASGSQITAPTMHQTDSFRYMESDGFQVLELPYANGRLAMDILLPTQGGLSGLDSNQVPADINGWLSGLGVQSVAVSLPKFQMTTQFKLSDPLEALGMTDAFTRAADFSKITDPSQLMIDQVYHKAFISIDEAGTEAAAATAVVAEPLALSATISPPIDFNADHPFLFLIRDTQSGSVLFMGQVENPTQTTGDSSAPVIVHEPHDPVTPAPVIPTPVTPTPIITTPPPDTTPPTIPNQPGTAGLSANEKLVDAYYEALLGRAAEPAALTYWSKVLDGGASRVSVADDIEATTEYRQAEVKALYQRYLGRASDAGGLDYYTAKLASGGTVEQVADALAGSPEFAQAHGGASKLVDALFTTVLGRSADAGSLALFEQKLAAGQTASQIAASMLASDEYQQKLAGALMAKFLDRASDPAGVNHFSAELRAGATRDRVATEILAADEFFARATGGA